MTTIYVVTNQQENGQQSQEFFSTLEAAKEYTGTLVMKYQGGLGYSVNRTLDCNPQEPNYKVTDQKGYYKAFITFRKATLK